MPLPQHAQVLPRGSAAQDVETQARRSGCVARGGDLKGHRDDAPALLRTRSDGEEAGRELSEQLVRLCLERLEKPAADRGGVVHQGNEGRRLGVELVHLGVTELEAVLGEILPPRQAGGSVAEEHVPAGGRL